MTITEKKTKITGFRNQVPKLSADDHGFRSNIYRPQHLAYLEEKSNEGKIFARGRFADGWGGMVIYQCESLEEARELAENDPYIIYKARNYEIHEWEMVFCAKN